MHNFGNFFLCALAACILWQGSFAEDQSGYICLIDDPKQNQCNSICLTELSPRLSEIVKAQNQGHTNTRESDKEIKSKLETLEVKIGEVQDKLFKEVHAKLEGQLQGVEAKLEGQLQEVQNKMENKLEGSLDALQTKLETQLQVVLTKIENQLKIDTAEMKNHLQQILVKMEATQAATKTIPSGFKLIGSRYFRIVEEEADWETAERRCREMGGYLASFQNEEEFNAIIPKLQIMFNYWVGINDRDNENSFISVASHKPAKVLKWQMREPDVTNHDHNCVALYTGKMFDGFCGYRYRFICQADNET